MKLQAPKGTQDVLPSDVARWQTIERIARAAAERFGFHEIRTPVFEHSELFHRSAGETTDIVRKETYTFDDRGGRSLTLRPEGTAGVVRAVIEHGLVNDPGSRAKVYYLGPNFRYERPQSGRLRIHHQFGAEAFGVAEPEQDVECILLQLAFYRDCGLRDLAIRINSLGDRDSKQRYRDVLFSSLSPRRGQLSEDSQRRLDENPLRILDSKDPRDVEACRDLPPAHEHLSDASRTHFERVAALLRDAGVSFTVDGRLVRGFDYYTGTLWEVTAGGLGAQDAVGGGGRYDNLVEQLGGKPTPGVGFGSGLERLLLALEAQQVSLKAPPARLVFVVTHGETANREKLALLSQLRDAGLHADADLTGRSVKAQFKLADREGARLCVVLGEQELADGTTVVKDLASGEQQVVRRAELVDRLRSLLSQ
jgi:histidyl-tRNA synthetase